MKEELLELIYPRRCAVCDKILGGGEAYVHSDCRERLQFLTGPRCSRCGKPLEKEEQEYCYDCTVKNYHYKRGFPVLRYDKLISHSIAEFKYKGKREYAEFYIDELVKAYGAEISSLHLDGLVPVPVHKTKLRQRGYNQADLIATGIGKQLDLPVYHELLIRNRKTLPQKGLNEKERLKNLLEAFETGPSADFSKLHRIMIIDDIYTSGSTVESCTKILLEAGVHEVYYASICIGKGY